MQMNTSCRLIAATVLLALAATGCVSQRDVPAIDKPVITFDGETNIGKVSPLLFGVNHRWVSNAAGSADPSTGLTYPRVVDQIRNVGLTLIRYPGGTLANMFQWERAIGPRATRGRQIGGLLAMPLPYDSNFGPDEFGDLLDRTGATGTLMLNLATATAADAANFISYMTAPAGSPPVNGVDWAARRAANGHSAPYRIAYAEIGNEYDPSIQPLVDQNYWIVGEPVQIAPSCKADKISCLYAFGGATRFTDQPVVLATDWRAPASLSTNKPGQVVYARYAPVVAGSEEVFVNGVAWKRASRLQSEPSDSRAYTITEATGAIAFGDGIHGAIPPTGARISVSYTSGPHEGFVDFYRAIKAANPLIRVCTSIHDESFLRIMGDTYAYDCIQQHPYVIAGPKRDLSTSLDDYFVQTAHDTIKLGAQVQHTQEGVAKYAGSRAGNIGLFLTEYGQLGTFPPFSSHYARSLGQGVLEALCIREWVLRGVEGAGRTVLTDYTFEPIPPDLAAVQMSNAGTAGDFAILGGPGPDTVVTPVGWAMKLLRENTAQTLIRSDVRNNPVLESEKGDTLGALHAYATRDADGHVYLVVINADPSRDLMAIIAPSNFQPGRTAQVSTLASPGIADENNRSSPMHIAIKIETVEMAKLSFEHRFPAHSVTAIRLHPR